MKPSLSYGKSACNSTKTTLSVVYITPEWLVWAESTDKKGASAGSARLKYIDVCDYRDTASHTIMPDQGLSITGRYTDKNKTGINFIGLDTNIDGQKFCQALEQQNRVVTMSHIYTEPGGESTILSNEGTTR